MSTDNLTPHQRFIASVKSRVDSGAFSTADRTAEAALACFDGACSRYFSAGLDREAAIKRAADVATYYGEQFTLEEKATAASRFKQLLPEGVEAPKHTQMVLVHTLTTPREDRDKDVLKTEGAQVDPAMPLLWQHIPSLPIGKLIATLDHDKSRLRVATALLDLNDLTSDAMKLFEAGALRFSHGFRVLDFVERKARPDELGPPGFEVTRFEIMEESAVSVPSNVDAVVEMFAKGALSSEPMKAMGKRLFDGRSKVFRGIEFPAEGVEVITDVTVGEEGAIGATKTRVFRGSRMLPKQTGVPVARKMFDVSTERLSPATVEIDWAARFLGVAVKDVHVEATGAGGPMRGGFMQAMDSVLRGWNVEDTRNLDREGEERPPVHETVQIKSDQRRTFLVEGVRFFSHPDGRRLVYRTFKSWHGQDYLIYTADHEVAHDVIDGAWKELETNNPLRGEAFSLTGGFIDRKGIGWEDVFLEDATEKALKRTVRIINEKGSAAANRGVILQGPPGTGKTLSARVMLNEAKATFIWVSAKDFWRTGSFAAFSGALSLARSLAPAIVCYEDVDNWIDSYTVDLLKGEMDGLVQNSGVTTLLTTNFPEKLPAALVDRPGRFHDVLEVHLPSKDVRVRMLTKWADGATPDVIRKMADETDGYSGAHLYELARFAHVLADEDEIGLDDALSKAFAKIKEQRELIDQSQLSGSSYRPSRRQSEPAAKSCEWTVDGRRLLPMRRDDTPDRDKDDPATLEQRSDPPACTCGDDSARREIDLALLLPAQMYDIADVTYSITPKAGRVLSAKNLQALKDVRDDLDEMSGMDKMPRPATALLERSIRKLSGVIDAQEAEKPPKEPDEEKPGKSAKELAGEALALADGDDLKAIATAFTSALAAHELEQLAAEIEEAEAALA